MTRLGKFFRKHLGKYILSRPTASETEHRESTDNEQSSEDPGHTSRLLNSNERADNTSSLSHTTNVTAKSSSNVQRITDHDQTSGAILSKTSENLSTVESAINQSQSQVGWKHTEEFSQIAGTKTELSLSLPPDTEPIESNEPRKSDLNRQIPLQQTEVSESQPSKDLVLSSDGGHQKSFPVEQELKVTLGLSEQENATNSVPQSSQQAETLTQAGQAEDMVSRPQNVPTLAAPKLSELPSNSTSLRNYLESTSVRRPTPPREVASPRKNSSVPNRHPAPPRSISPRHSAPPETSAAPVKGEYPPVRPASAKKISEVKDVPKDATESPLKVDEGNEKASEKNPVVSSIDEEVSLITLTEVSDSTKEVIETAMKRFGMKEMTTQGYWNVRWSDNGVSIQVCQKLQKYQRINRFPGSGLLMTKNNLAKNTSKMKLSFPEDYDFVPETWCLSSDISKVELYARVHERDCFIVKPNDGSSGKGIIITRNIGRLKMCEKMVCQVYIRKPFLIDGFKFDLRVYTLITSCRPLRLFVYNEGLARFATEPYEEPNPQNESNRYMHLTNYAVNKHSPSYTVDETKGTLRRLSTINKWLMRHNVDAKKVWESMDDAIIKTIISFLPALRHNYRVSFPQQTDSNSCFQILGFDIIFDDNLKPYVLEVNDSPSFKADVPLDKEMTESLIHDTFNILHLDENNRSQVIMEEKRQSRMRLLSSSSVNRNAIYKEKQQNERLLTQSRIEWENAHMGNYRKVYPNDQKMKHYKKFIRTSQDIFINHP